MTIFAIFILLLSACYPWSHVLAKKMSNEVSSDISHTALKRFEGHGYGFSLSYPPDWKIIKQFTTEPGLVSSVAFGPTLGSMNDGEMVAVIAVHDISSSYSLEDYVEESVAYIRALVGSTVNVMDLGYENISEVQGHSFLVSINSYFPPLHLDSYQIFVLHNNDVYLIAYFGGAGYQTYFSDARDLMNSIQFTDVMTGIPV